ncbi:hypothetical protein F2Q70_00014922 [Brassica cretica]|uniref:Uncharacterized protein n=1 Tax=Brassica cretica TaxID=69181 RepID=A0A8S9HSE9_BRACR|nr:hypothetical protein F2Q70_00014922 [Brassica cretica]
MVVFPIGSPLVADVSRAILQVQESNKVTQLENAWFKKIDESCPDPFTNPTHIHLYPSANLASIVSGFCFLLPP